MLHRDVDRTDDETGRSPMRRPSARPRLGLWRRFARDRDGATAVEFAIIAVPFLGMLFAVLQTALELWCSQVLESAVQTASRKLYTGQFQTDASNSGLTTAQLQAKFKTLVCDQVVGLFACQTMVSVDVKRFPNGTTPTVSKPVTNGAYDTSSFSYDPPQSGEIAVVRASMEYPIFVKLMPNGTMRNGNRLLMGSATFRAEPYGS